MKELDTVSSRLKKMLNGDDLSGSEADSGFNLPLSPSIAPTSSLSAVNTDNLAPPALVAYAVNLGK